MGIDTDREPLRHAPEGTFDGQFVTAIPPGKELTPMRVGMCHRGEEPINRLFAALEEAASKTQLASSAAKELLVIASEFFAAADFETTANARFLMLSTVFEVLGDPKPRLGLCLYLVADLIENIKKAQAIAKSSGDAEMAEALRGLRDAVVHWEKELITSSIRKLATKASRVLGDADPEQSGKRGGDLYVKRNGLVHRGESVSWADVAEFRKLAREALAVEAGCYEHIRERFP